MSLVELSSVDCPTRDSFSLRTIDRMERASNRVELVDNFLDLFYRKSLGEKIIAENKQLIRTIDQLYETGEDATANNYLLSVFLVRVGCSSKSYDLSEFSQLDRQSREKFVEQNWSGKKVLVRLKRSTSDWDDEVRRFECLLSSFSCLRFDDLIRSTRKTNLKLMVESLLEDLKSTLVELRFTALVALQSINKSILRLVVHQIKGKRPKISPVVSEKELNKLVEFVVELINQHLFDRILDSNEEIRQFFYETLIDLIEVWPNQWIGKSLLDHWIYSIVSQEKKIEVNKSARCWQSLLSNKDLDRSSFKSSVEHLLVRLSSMKFELISTANGKVVLKLIDDCLRVYPELSRRQTIIRCSSAIIDKNLSMQKLSWTLFLRWFELTRRFDESLWSRLFDLLFVLFENSMNERIIWSLVDSLEKNNKLRAMLFDLESIEALLVKEIIEQETSNGRRTAAMIFARCLIDFHWSRTLNHQLSMQMSEILSEIVGQILVKEPSDEILLVESLFCLRTISLRNERTFVESNRETTVALLNELQLIRTTRSLSRANIEQN